jgi:hypothetical protein
MSLEDFFVPAIKKTIPCAILYIQIFCEPQPLE